MALSQGVCGEQEEKQDSCFACLRRRLASTVQLSLVFNSIELQQPQLPQYSYVPQYYVVSIGKYSAQLIDSARLVWPKPQQFDPLLDDMISMLVCDDADKCGIIESQEGFAEKLIELQQGANLNCLADVYV